MLLRSRRLHVVSAFPAAFALALIGIALPKAGYGTEPTGQTPASAANAPIQATAADHVATSEVQKFITGNEWDEVVTYSTQVFDQTPPLSAPYLGLFHFYRGDAYQRLGAFDNARSDFEAATRISVPTGWVRAAAEDRLKTVNKIISVRPPVRRDITIDGQVRFTIYADADDIVLHQIAELCPVAANTASVLLGAAPRRTTINIFETVAGARAFADAPYAAPNPYFDKNAWARGGCEGEQIIVEKTGDKYAFDPSSAYFRAMVAHEYMHVNIHRTIGTRAKIPAWLDEGIAMLAGLRTVPSEYATYTGEFRQMVDRKTVMGMDIMDSDHFGAVAYAPGAAERSEFPYAQALSMATFLSLGRKDSIFGDLLITMRDTGDFDTAFQRTFGESVKDFYTEWRSYALPKK